MINKLKPYKKTVAAVIIGLLGWATAVVASDASGITSGEWIQGATALVTAIGVFSWANEAPAPDAKDYNTP